MRRSPLIMLLGIVVVTGLASLAVAATASDSQVTPAASAEIKSVTAWVNGEKQNIPFGTIDLYVTNTDIVTFTATGKYTGPAGTHGMFYITETTDVKDTYKIIPEGKTVKIKATQGWTRFTDGTRTFMITILGPDGITGGYGDSRPITVHWG
jgi:hypothetical protein